MEFSLGMTSIKETYEVGNRHPVPGLGEGA